MPDPRKEESAVVCGLKDIVAGSARGMAQVCVGHPLDTLKVRLQTQTPEQLKYSGSLNCLITTLKEEGIVGLYKGAASPLAGCALYSSVLFLAYGQSKRFFQLDESPDRKDIQLSKRIGIGMTTGFCASLAEGPIDLIKSKMQVQYRISIEGTSRMAFVPYKSSWDCLRRILATYGIRGVYQGLSATFLRNMPGSAVYFTTYEVVRRNVATLYPQSETTSVLLAGAIAGITFWLSCFPADVIKSTLQTDASYKPDRKYKGILDCTRQIFRREGLLGFWKGFMPCLIRAGPVNAATFFVYENTRRMMD